MVIALAVAGCGGPARARTPAPVVGTNVSGLMLQALDGGDIALGKLRGKVVVVHLFTTWSVASQVDVEKLSALHDQGKSDVAVLGVALDPDGYRLAAPWRAAMKPTYQIALATDALRSGRSVLGRIRQVPTTLVVDRSGRVRSRIERQLADGELARAVEAARRPR